MSEFDLSGYHFSSPETHRRLLQARHYLRAREAVWSLADHNGSDSNAVLVARPAKLFARDTLRTAVPRQPAHHWTVESEHRGWLLENVSEPPETSVTKDLGRLLLLDDLRYVVPSRYVQWGETGDGLVVPAPYLTVLNDHAPVRMERVSAELEMLVDKAVATPPLPVPHDRP